MDPKQMIPPNQDLGETIEDVGKSTWHLVWHHHGLLFGSVLAVSIALSAVISIAMYEAYVQHLGAFPAESIIFPIAPLFVSGLMYSYFASKVQSLFMRQMAASLGYIYAPTAPADSVDGLFFKIGYGGCLSDVMSGTYRDSAVRLFTYQYTTGSGKTRQTHIVSVFELQYAAPLPHITMNFPFLTGTSGLERVELEGNFGENFTLHVEKGKQMEVREIFQPDVMQDFMALLSGYTMEIFHDRVYLIRTGTITNKQKFLEITGVIDRVYDDMLPGLRAAAQS